MLPLSSAPCPLSSPASSGSCSIGSGTPPAQGEHCRLSGEQRVKEVKAAREGWGDKGKATRSQAQQARKAWTRLAYLVFLPTFPSILQHQQNKSLQPSKERVTLEQAACTAAVGNRLLCCPWTQLDWPAEKRNVVGPGWRRAERCSLPDLPAACPCTSRTMAMAPVT